jgi:hypothetical protein
MAKKKSPEGMDEKQRIVNISNKYKQEAESARISRLLQNLENFDVYHLRQDWSSKQPGQSKEFLAKVAMATEQLTSFIEQGLADSGDSWYTVEGSPGAANKKIRPSDIKLILSRQLEKTKIYNQVGDGLKLSLLSALMIYKVDTKEVNAPKYVARKVHNKVTRKNESRLYRMNKKHRQLLVDTIPFRDYRCDPTGRGLYESHTIESDMHEVKRLVKSAKNPNGIYDAEQVNLLSGDTQRRDEAAIRLARETGQNVTDSSYRKRVQIDEYWGTVLDEDGEVLYENCVWAIANERFLIRAPEPNPFWHQESPFVVGALIRVPKSVNHKALMDAPVKHNKAINELFNLMLDNGIMSVYGVKQIRMDWLEDPSQVANGVMPGVTLKVNSLCPPNAKVVDRVDTAVMSPEAIQIFNLTNGEFQQSTLTNDIRLGILPQRDVKATEVVASEQSVTGMLNGLAKTIETDVMVPLLRKSWMVAIQHLDDFNSDEVRKLLGDDRASIIASMAPEERFAETVNGLCFVVHGLSYVLNKTKDFRRVTTFMQTVAGNPALAQEFSREYSWAKLLGEIMEILDIDPDKLKLDEADRAENAIGGGAPGGSGGPGGAPVAGPNVMSQIPQAGSEANGGQAPDSVQAISQPKFPPSRATGALK